MRSEPSTRAAGADAEERARRYLERQGLVMVERNFHSRRGEIDLVMRDGDTLVFVEVRFRRNSRFGTAAESVTPAKQRRIIDAARYFLNCRRQWNDCICRFDVLAISGQTPQDMAWIKDAFRLS
jgi:putative endonuclease